MDGLLGVPGVLVQVFEDAQGLFRAAFPEELKNIQLRSVAHADGLPIGAIREPKSRRK
jgi:hypothetical protein